MQVNIFVSKISIFILNLFTNKKRLLFPMKESIIQSHFDKNQKAWKHRTDLSSSFYIENQESLEDFYYGIDWNKKLNQFLFDGEPLNASLNSCEVIAIYNALQFLHDGKSPMSFPSLLTLFEQEGIVLSGYFGTSPNALKKYFNQRSSTYISSSVSGRKLINKPDIFSKFEKYDTFIFMAFNNHNSIKSGIHTVCICKEKVDAYRIHNCNLENTLFPNLKSAINGFQKGKGYPLLLIGVSLT